MFCALLTSRYQVSVYRTNGPLVIPRRANKGLEFDKLTKVHAGLQCSPECASMTKH